MADPDSLYVKYDDMDPNVVYDVFDHVWYDNENDEAYDNTLSSTVETGAMVTFDFFGSEIVVVGTTFASLDALDLAVLGGGTVTHYILDDSPNTYTAYAAPVENASSVTFYNSGPLIGGRHSLKIIVAAASDDFPFFLDYFAVLPANETIPFLPSSTSSSSSMSSAAIASSSASSSQLSSNSALDPKRIAAIVGGVLGGVLVLAALAMIIWFIRARRRRGWESRYTGLPRDALLDEDKGRPRREIRESGLHAAQIEPFLAPPPGEAYADGPPSSGATAYETYLSDSSAPTTRPYGTPRAGTLTGTDGLRTPRMPLSLPDIPRITISSKRVFPVANDAGTDADSARA